MNCFISIHHGDSPRNRNDTLISDTLSSGQVSAWQSATLLPISCKSVQPVPAWLEEPVSPLRQSSSGGATNNAPFPKIP